LPLIRAERTVSIRRLKKWIQECVLCEGFQEMELFHCGLIGPARTSHVIEREQDDVQVTQLRLRNTCISTHGLGVDKLQLAHVIEQFEQSPKQWPELVAVVVEHLFPCPINSPVHSLERVRCLRVGRVRGIEVSKNVADSGVNRFLVLPKAHLDKRGSEPQRLQEVFRQDDEMEECRLKLLSVLPFTLRSQCSPSLKQRRELQEPSAQHTEHGKRRKQCIEPTKPITYLPKLGDVCRRIWRCARCRSGREIPVEVLDAEKGPKCPEANHKGQQSQRHQTTQCALRFHLVPPSCANEAASNEVVPRSPMACPFRFSGLATARTRQRSFARAWTQDLRAACLPCWPQPRMFACWAWPFECPSPESVRVFLQTTRPGTLLACPLA
jgi:hypothetical protein